MMNNIANILGRNEDMPNELQTQSYKDIMGFYDDAEKLIKIAEKYGSKADPYIGHLQKLIDQIEKSSEIILDNFLKTVENGHSASNMQKLKVENSAKDIKMAVQKFLNTISQ